MKEWKLVNIVSDGQPIIINGINLWKHEWIRIDEKPIEVPHPGHPNEKHKMWIYKINTGNNSIVFAAGEYSNCVWGFYVPAV